MDRSTLIDLIKGQGRAGGLTLDEAFVSDAVDCVDVWEGEYDLSKGILVSKQQRGC